jgi:hypothetical protein
LRPGNTLPYPTRREPAGRVFRPSTFVSHLADGDVAYAYADIDLNELVGKEDWSSCGESFIALRQTIFTMLVSSNGIISPPSSYAQGETIVDLTDPILSDTGLICVLMDMVLRRFLQTGAPQKMVGQ